MKNEKSLFQFTNPYLIKSFFEENVDFNDELETEMELVTETKVNRTSEKTALVTLLFKNAGDNLPFNVEIIMSSEFEWQDENMGEEILENLLVINAPALILSYIRPLIATLTSVSRFPTWHIPFINMKNNTLKE